MKTRTQWKELLKQFPELHFLSWLDCLPCYDTDGQAIKCCNPIVHFDPNVHNILEIDKKLAKHGHKLVNSTVWYIAGQHYPRHHIDRAIGYPNKGRNPVDDYVPDL
jgi:hypothetical protein